MSDGDPACPSDESLVRFLTGRTPDAERDRIGRHVDVCSTCAHILALPDSLPRTGGARAPDRKLLGTSLESGDVLADRYRIVKLLGAGGMGEVYEAFDLELSDRVALKTVRATIADDARAVERLKSEVQLARKVTHPNVCRIFDFGIHRAGASRDAYPFMTMELLRGTTLAHWLIEHGRPTPQQAVAIAADIAAGLAAAHAVGVIHKDLKSENIFLTQSTGSSWRAMVTDFGLAAAHDLVADAGESVRNPARFSGTPGYVAPERMAGAAATTASDVFAFGVVAMDLLSGDLPTQRTAAPRVPPELGGLDALARRCRAPRPGVRPPLEEIVDELKRLAGDFAPLRPARGRWLLLGGGVAIAAAIVGIASVRARSGRRLLEATSAATPAPPAVVAPGAAASTTPPPVAPSTPEPAPTPDQHPAPRRRVHATQPPIHAAIRPTLAPRTNEINEPIRTLGPYRPAKQKDDAPIDVISHAR